MKKIVLVALISCLSVQAEEVMSSNGVKFYAGASLIGSWTGSDFNMDYTVDGTNFPDARPWASHKENSIGRVGMGLAAGVKKTFNSDWFIGGELNYTLSRATHRHDFFEADDAEFDAVEDTDRVSYIKVRHGDEWGLSLKIGKEINCYSVYGILGATTKRVDIEYSLDGSNPDVIGDGFGINPKKRVWGAVFGLGGSKKINNRVSCSLEYKYKAYNSAKKNVDCVGLSRNAYGAAHDTSVRNFKVKSDKHELSLGITFNI